MGIDIPYRVDMQTALAEAMDNMEHAYPVEYFHNGWFGQSQWWMFASYNKQAGNITAVFYDQGIGIPKTLGAKPSDILDSLSNFHLMDDSHKIENAVKFGRSRINRKKINYRGSGLDKMKNYIDLIGKGRLRIISSKGEYIYHGRNKIAEHKLHKSRLHGTLIEWSIDL
jgi:hypothetical protein